MYIGIWLQDLRKRAGPVAEKQTYIGTDLVTDLFPNPRPEGIEFIKQSITEPWPTEWHESFDLVHQRQVLGFCGDFSLEQAVANLCGLAKPGGWVELVELDCDQSTLGEGTAAREFFQLLEQIWKIKKMGGNFGPNLKEWMENAGLEDVQVDILQCKVGAKAKPELKQASINGAAGAGPMIVAMARSKSYSNMFVLQVTNYLLKLSLNLKGSRLSNSTPLIHVSARNSQRRAPSSKASLSEAVYLLEA